MRIKEHTVSRMVVTRGSLLDRALFSIFIMAGLGMLLFSGRLDPPIELWLLLGTIFLAAGSYFWTMSGDMTLTLDRRSGLMQLDWAQSRGHKSQSAPLDEIIELRVQDGDDADRLYFALKGGERIPLTPYSYTGGDHPKVRSAINAWLAETG